MRTIVCLVVLCRLASAGSTDAFVAGKLAYDARDWQTAEEIYRLAIEAFPDDPQVGEAGLQWLETLGRLDRLDEVTDHANFLLDLRPNAKGPTRKRLLEIRARGISLAVRSMCGEGSVSEAEVLRLISLPHSR
jgi:hypothetical protein